MSSTEESGVDQHARPIHIVIVELHHHSELIQNLIAVLGMEGFRASIVTVPEVMARVDVDWERKADWLRAFCKRPEESVGEFIDRMKPVFESGDILYFNTVRHFWTELCRIPFSAPSIIRVHNAHADLAPAHHFYRPLVKFPAILSHLIRKVLIAGEWREREQFLAHIDYFMFPNRAVTNYVADQGWVSRERILPPVMPFGFLGEMQSSESPTGQRQCVTIAITGKVTNAKKDYDLVCRALRQCLERLKLPVKLVLLGKAAGKQAERIVAKFNSLESAQFSLDYSRDYVSSEEFQQKVSGVDFLLAPIKVDTHFRKYREVYGKSKMSGIENDILLYRKPSLVTSRYQIQGDIDRVVEYFDPTPESLAAVLTSWVNEEKYADMQASFEAMNQYRPAVVAREFHQLCQQLVAGAQSKSER